MYLSLSSMALLIPFPMCEKIKLNGKTKVARLIKMIIQHLTQVQFIAILESSFVPPTSQNRILYHGFTENNVHKVYQLPFTITKEVKVIMFQYKIIHNILPTQISLYRDGFSDSDVCPLCHHEQQTLSHLLVTCIETASFWQTFQVWWYGKTGENLLLNQGKILYGFFENTAHWQALNYLRGILSKICVRVGHGTSPIWLKFCMWTCFGVLTTKWMFQSSGKFYFGSFDHGRFRSPLKASQYGG